MAKNGKPKKKAVVTKKAKSAQKKSAPKAALKKAAPKKAMTKKPARSAKVKAAPKKAAANAQSLFMKPMNVSIELAVIVGKGPMPRSEVVKRLWAYIRKEGLQDPVNKRNINANADLQKVFEGKTTVSMFEMTQLVSKHLS